MYDRYDRQVRLIGKDVQNKIENLSVCVIDHSKSFVSGEIVKNLTLLGVRKLKLNKTALVSYEKLVLGEICKLNNNLELQIVNELDLECDVKISVNLEVKDEDTINICTQCYSFATGYSKKCDGTVEDTVKYDTVQNTVEDAVKYDTVHNTVDDTVQNTVEDTVDAVKYDTVHNTVDTVNDTVEIVKDCLLGAFVIQEIIKKIADKPFLKEYTLDIN
ncbi:SUMO-activating enzyme subunit aos-1 [Nosema granulosis]|uniref:SUMO-activating enzyme subunit aos-1 n=1 Tax=Nosema granulosis TaxID=83296 RepID=A0A9P6H1A4_9MICR|nr:SUMO-activating enzyme subunit aos-1 [Nosema granulosis]